MRRVCRAYMLVALVALFGCRSHHSCDPADSKALCIQVQNCYDSGASPFACREAEKDALQLAKPDPGVVDKDAGKALTY
jgi:hypothetical protein